MVGTWVTLGTLDIKGLQDLLYLRYPGTHTFDLERGTGGTQVPLLSISELSKEGPDCNPAPTSAARARMHPTLQL